MLLKFTIENFEVFQKPVELSMEANLHTRKFLSNVIQSSQGNALKALAIYGPNNTGKTCTIEAIVAYRDVLLNRPFRFSANVFSGSNVVRLGAEFLSDGTRFTYSFDYDTNAEAYQREHFGRIEIDEYGNRKEIVYFERDTQSKTSYSIDAKLRDIIGLSSKDSILIYAFDTSDFPLLDEAKRVLRKLADSIVFLNMNQISPLKTIEVLKKPDTIEAKKVVSLIKAADLDIDDFQYAESIEIEFKSDDDKDERLKKAIQNADQLMDQLRLISVHRGKPLPSIKFDSSGTKNYINASAQLICTTHDVSLLDIKTLFRKDQIWFTDKDIHQAYLYSLAQFTAEKDGVRSESDIIDKYSKGAFGALPDPSLVEALLSVSEEGE